MLNRYVPRRHIYFFILKYFLYIIKSILNNVQNIGELNQEIPWVTFEEWVGISLLVDEVTI